MRNEYLMIFTTMHNSVHHSKSFHDRLMKNSLLRLQIAKTAISASLSLRYYMALLTLLEGSICFQEPQRSPKLNFGLWFRDKHYYALMLCIFPLSLLLVQQPFGVGIRPTNVAARPR